MKPPVGRGRIDSESGKSTAGLLWLATHRQLFKDVTRPGSVTLQFDDTGVWDPDRKVGIYCCPHLFSVLLPFSITDGLV